jgi:hypothetical protein
MANDAKVAVNLQYPPETDTADVQIPKLINITGFTKKVDSTYQLPIGTGTSLSLGDLDSPKAVYMTTDQDITVYINDMTDGISLAMNGILIIAGGPTIITSIKVDTTILNTSVRLWAVQ